MSNKLLMNNISNIEPPTSDVVRNGLVCWLDGRDGKDPELTWKDRENNLIFNMHESANHWFDMRYAWTGKSFYIKNHKDNFYKKGFVCENTYNLFTNNYTLQFSFIIEKLSKYPYIFSCNDRYIKCWLEKSNKIDATIGDSEKLTKEINIALNEKIDITFIYDGYKATIYYNGEPVLEKIAQLNNITNFIIFEDLIDTDVENRVMYGFLNSFKIYNRALSIQEINYNIQYENKIPRGL